jgi:phospholipid-transporting ATPase
MAVKLIDPKDYYDLENQLNDIDNHEKREAFLYQMATKLEKDLYLIGCTAIEDRLQDNVP